MVQKICEGIFIEDRIIAEKNNFTVELFEKSRFGEAFGKKKYQYSLVEGLYLWEKGKIKIKTSRKELDFGSYLKKAKRKDKNFLIRYAVYKDMRNRGYIVKTALKFGADFRVYDRGIKPGEDHAKWIIYPVSEVGSMTWYEFAAKNRVAHSTKKRLLIGIVDEELSVTYYEIAWKRP